MCWKSRDHRRFTLSKGISSNTFFAGGISNTDKSFLNDPPLSRIHTDSKTLERERSLARLNRQDKAPESPAQEIVVPTLTKDRTPSPAIVIEDYDSKFPKRESNHLQLQIPSTHAPSSSASQIIANEAGPRPFHSPLKQVGSPNRLHVKNFMRNSPSSSPKSAKFSIEGRRSQEESIGSGIGSGRASPASVAPSWRTEDARYSGITVKIATREVMRSEQPQFNLGWQRAGALEDGVGKAC